MKAYRNFSQIVTLKDAFNKDGRNLKPEDLSILKNASIVFDENEILWVGKDSKFPQKFSKAQKFDFTGKVLLPEIVDCHTHIVYGGDRAEEYSMRLNGADYEAIAKAGGGILNTMNGTNSLTRSELFNLAMERINRLHSYGVGTIEIKSGYGLNYDKEKEISFVINDLKNHFSPSVQIKNTYLAAHAVPSSFNSSADYMNQVVLPLLKELAPLGIIDAVDIFHEVGYFDDKDTEALFGLASELNIPIKSHADEFYDNKGALLATRYNALSTDHLMKTNDDGIEAIAKSKTVATLLPGTSFFLGKEQAPARKFLDTGCKVAISSDYNPGSCHCDNVLMVAALAAPKYKLNLCELWAAITLNAAHALGLHNQGTLVEGMKPRFTVFNTDSIDRITYNWGRNFNFPLKDF